MTANNITVQTLVYNGEIIRDKGEMLSLTDMWKASGSDPARQPSNWLGSAEASRFVEYVSDILNPGISGNELVRSIRGGRSPGTWAHWQISFAYAKYLSPAFHAWCNEVVRERMEGKPSHADELIVRTNGMSKALVRDVTDLRRSVSDLAAQVHGLMLNADPRRAALEYVSVRELLDEAGAIQRRRNGLNRKIGNRMRNQALLAGHTSPCRRCPHSGVWLFQRDFAAQYMAEHGRELVIAHNERQLGQGVLRFPRKGEKPSHEEVTS